MEISHAKESPRDQIVALMQEDWVHAPNLVIALAKFLSQDEAAEFLRVNNLTAEDLANEIEQD